MRLHTTSRNTRLTPALKRLLEERLARLERFAAVTEARVIVTGEKYRQIVEVILHTRRDEFRAREESNDLALSIDGAIDRLERQLKKTKERRSALRTKSPAGRAGADRGVARRAAAAAAAAAEAAAEAAAAAARAGREARAAVEEGPARGPRIVPSRGLPGKPLTLAEAAETLLTSGRPFLPFMNAETGEMNVLFPRPDGDLGLIAPKTARRR
jgi:putative sigma-54 modulation protein